MSDEEKPRAFWEKYDSALTRILRLLGIAGVGVYVYFGVVLGKDVHAAFLWICALGIHGKEVLSFVAGKLK